MFKFLKKKKDWTKYNGVVFDGVSDYIDFPPFHKASPLEELVYKLRERIEALENPPMFEGSIFKVYDESGEKVEVMACDSKWKHGERSYRMIEESTGCYIREATGYELRDLMIEMNKKEENE